MMACTKAIPMIAYIGIAALLAAATSPTAAQNVQVQSVVAIDGKVRLLFAIGGRDGATRPCEGFTPPPKVAVGETVQRRRKDPPDWCNPRTPSLRTTSSPKA